MIKIYHNPKCRKSREGLKFLQSLGVDFKVLEYLKKSLSVDELREILKKLGKKPDEIIRQQEDYYKKELKNKHFTDEEWLIILTENPALIQRPIVVGKYRAVIAQPPELMLRVIK
ncbi:MAG: arsenate reductase (glutaredoxin) [Bacteroidetes bacterium RBG_13_42_15]|nr:MAG: arsenate reductase (glutaredoxin) [Bacteroidetes bacterium RBG_13_42_15]HJX71014.1 arsenate reductase family protein [Bacteroidales bacterium]